MQNHAYTVVLKFTQQSCMAECNAKTFSPIRLPITTNKEDKDKVPEMAMSLPSFRLLLSSYPQISSKDKIIFFFD